MTDFTKTAINQNAKREFVAPIPDIDSFEEVVTAFENDTTMGFTKKKKTECTYKTQVEYFDTASNKHGYVNIYAASTQEFEDGVSLFTGTEAAETMAGVGGSASCDDSEDAWTAKFSCTNLVGEVEDSFSVTFTKSYMSVTGFTHDATLDKIEVWADKQTMLE